MAVSKVEEWAAKTSFSKGPCFSYLDSREDDDTESCSALLELGPIARDSFDHLVSASNVLVIDKNIFASDFDYASIFPSLNVRQIELIVAKFVTDEFAPKAVPSTVFAKLKVDAQSSDISPNRVHLDPSKFIAFRGDK